VRDYAIRDCEQLADVRPQSRGQLPGSDYVDGAHGQRVPTSESKEAIASYPEIPGMRLIAGCRPKPSTFLNQRKKVQQEGERREIFRYLGEVAGAVASIKGYNDQSKRSFTINCGRRERRTSVADVQLDDRGKKVQPAGDDFGENVLIVNQDIAPQDNEPEMQDGQEN
jgi:hypothetical protein